jgi:signal transduction histidine kinase
MNCGVKLRLAILGLAVGLMGALIVLVVFNSKQQAAELRASLGKVDSETFRIADNFKDSLREVNNAMLRYRIDRDTNSWDQFLRVSHDLDVWVNQQAPRLTTQHEKDVLAQVNQAYDQYLRDALSAHQVIESSGNEPPSAGQFPELRVASQHLFDLGQKLAEAHYESRNQLLSHANHSLAQLRFSVLVLLGFLFVFGVAIAALAYRDLIAPLRLKLAETQAIAERNEKLASLGLLAAGVAHEIRNPLTAVKAALFIQQKKFQPGSVELEDVKRVEREISRLERIVSDFLLFARPTDPELVTLPADLPLLEVEHFFAPQLERSGIWITLETSAPMRINIDPAQIKQVLINLVQNAADSIGRDGAITLRARADHRHLANGETSVVVLEVEDTGKGIPPEAQKRIFDPFFTTKAAGTGLGLAIAARIVQKHGGLLQYKTQVNHGTTFGIVLPRANA